MSENRRDQGSGTRRLDHREYGRRRLRLARELQERLGVETEVDREKLNHMMDELEPDEVLRHAEIEVDGSSDENENSP